jgi:type IV secretion system protein VirB10
LQATGGLLRAADRSPAGESDPNHQSEKLAFLQKSQRSAYLGNRLEAPVSPYELKTGTVIPSLMIGTINSDLPGEIVAQVAQNVYDSATGKYLLIPQGSKLFGHYDARVAFGQERVLVSWQRLIFPNSYTLELDGMGGYDQEGKSGFGDRVDHHYGRVFGWGLVTSVLSAGFQLSQPQQANSLVPSNGQVAAAAVGQQMAQLGAQIASRNMQVQPTIEIRKGYRMNVMVNKDIVFPGSYQP